MKSWHQRFVATVLLMVVPVAMSMAQCAMCRGSVESSMGNGRNNVGVGLNTGILYLFVIPYLTVAVVGYLWYRSSKKDKMEREMIAARVHGALKNR
jgi:hypothetical protein